MSITPRVSLRRVRLIVPIFAVVLAVAGCKGTEEAKTAGPNDVGGTVVIATAADASSLLPGLVTVITDRQVTDLLFDRLADIGDNLNAVGDVGFKPQLAERWEWAADSMSIAFHINPHAKWHDGQPVRASDVRYSVNIIKDPAFGSQAIQLISNVDSVAVRDSVTAVVWFKRHTPEQFYDMVYQVVVVPEHVLGNTPVAKLKESEVSRRGIGSGRFRLAKWEAGSRIELVADTTNYRGRPKLDRIVFAISPDFNAAATRFFAGDADIFENLRAEQVAKLVQDTARRSAAYPSLQYAFLAFNLADPADHSKPNPIFSERAVRRALTMAVDRKAMLKNVFDSIARPLNGPFPYSLVVADTTLPQLPYDTVRAKALLDSAGWLAGTDGIRVKNGRRLEFSITTPSSSAARHQYAVLLQDSFRRIGIAVKLDESDFGSYMAKQNNRGFDTEMAVYQTDPSISGYKQAWGSAGIGKDGTNFTSYSSPTVDALLDSAILTFDPRRTKAYARRAFETMIEDAAGIWLYEPPTRAGIARRIHPTFMRADGWWAGLPDWWIPAAQRNARDKIGLRPAQ
jgi:peptide/nickel transport system substrate-binding protein